MDNTEQLMDKMHTPTPWSVHPVCILEYALKNGVPVGHPLSYEPGGFQVFTDDGRGNGLPLPEDDREANAAHIVRCVNSHDTLVEALRNLLIAEKIYDDDDQRLIACRDAAIDALKAATE